MPAKVKVPLKFSVKETYPNLLITDGYYYTNIYLTKEAFQAHQKKVGNIKITDLKGFLIDLNQWSLELALVDSTKVFSSY